MFTVAHNAFGFTEPFYTYIYGNLDLCRVAHTTELGLRVKSENAITMEELETELGTDGVVRRTVEVVYQTIGTHDIRFVATNLVSSEMVDFT